MNINTKRGVFWLGGIGLILSIPLVAMQFTQEVNWSLSDFFVFAGLLTTVGLIYELGIRKLSSSIKRNLVTLLLLLTFLLMWAELAVGIFSTPFSGS